MSIWSLFTWTMVGWAEAVLLGAVLALVGIGFAVPVAQSSSWFAAAQACLVSAALIFLGKVAQVAITHDYTFLYRAGICALLFAVVGVLTVEGTRGLETLSHKPSAARVVDHQIADHDVVTDLKPEPVGQKGDEVIPAVTNTAAPLTAPPATAPAATPPPVTVPLVEPKVIWRQQKIDHSGGKYRVEIVLEVDSEYADPIFGVLCDRPCTPELLRASGVSTSIVWTDGNNPNLGVGQITNLASLKAGAQVAWWIRSNDGKPIKVVAVKKARIKHEAK